nr:MAG TPA: hypothetical protein [Caudoviricetes sp.]
METVVFFDDSCKIILIFYHSFVISFYINVVFCFIIDG